MAHPMKGKVTTANERVDTGRHHFLKRMDPRRLGTLNLTLTFEFIKLSRTPLGRNGNDVTGSVLSVLSACTAILKNRG